MKVLPSVATKLRVYSFSGSQKAKGSHSSRRSSRRLRGGGREGGRGIACVNERRGHMTLPPSLPPSLPFPLTHLGKRLTGSHFFIFRNLHRSSTVGKSSHTHTRPPSLPPSLPFSHLLEQTPDRLALLHIP